MKDVDKRNLKSETIKYSVKQLLGEIVYRNNRIKVENLFDNNIIYLDENCVNWTDEMFDDDIFHARNVFNLSCFCEVVPKTISGIKLITFNTNINGKNLHFITAADDWEDTDEAKLVMCSDRVKINGLFFIHIGWDSYTMVPTALGVHM